MSQPPPDMPPPSYGSVPHQPTPQPIHIYRPRLASVLSWVGVGFMLLAVSQLLQLVAYRKGSLVVVRAGELGDLVAAAGYGVLAIAAWVAAAKAP